MKYFTSKSFVYLLLVVLVAEIFGGLIWIEKVKIEILREQLKEAYTQVKVPPINSQASKSEDDVGGSWLTYHNEEYGFKFEHPSSWYMAEQVFAWRSIANKDFVYGIEFIDSAGWEIEICAQGNAEVSHLNNPCDEVLTDLTKDELLYYSEGPATADNYFIRVFKSTLPLEEWLLVTYKEGGGPELMDYKIGKEIELSGRSGYESDTGCCGNTDIAYVIKESEYIYEFGTSKWGLTQNLKQAKAQFKLTDSDWLTYRNEEFKENELETSSTAVETNPLPNQDTNKNQPSVAAGIPAEITAFSDSVIIEKVGSDYFYDSYRVNSELSKEDREQRYSIYYEYLPASRLANEPFHVVVEVEKKDGVISTTGWKRWNPLVGCGKACEPTLSREEAAEILKDEYGIDVMASDATLNLSHPLNYGRWFWKFSRVEVSDSECKIFESYYVDTVENIEYPTNYSSPYTKMERTRGPESHGSCN